VTDQDPSVKVTVCILLMRSKLSKLHMNTETETNKCGKYDDNNYEHC
jgi:hypothetical protein